MCLVNWSYIAGLTSFAGLDFEQISDQKALHFLGTEN